MLKQILSALGLVSKREHQEAIRIARFQKLEAQIVQDSCEANEAARQAALIRELRLNLQARDAELQTVKAVAQRRLETMTQQSEQIDRLKSAANSRGLELAEANEALRKAEPSLRKAEMQLGVSRDRREEIGRQLDSLREVANDAMNFLLSNSSGQSDARELAHMLAEQLNT